jgi:tetratricopeptide (TPR) repeat protein
MRLASSLLASAALVVALLGPTSGASPAVGAQDAAEGASFQSALARAQAALEQGRLEEAARLATRALERDRRAPEAWALRAAVAAKLGDKDLAVHALHTELGLLVAQRAKKEVILARRTALEASDALAGELFGLKGRFITDFAKLAADYEKDGRSHGAIRAWKQVLALDPEHVGAAASIERIAAAPDPSLAADAKPVDLFADVTEEWIREHDAKHLEWEEAARLERPNYFTVTNAGYEVLVRTGEAMEQMASFYKQFFRYGTEEHGGSVPRITVHVFKNRDEYLEKGIGPPVEWSGGHFTGSHVECYIDGSSGFEGMVGTLFHEAAHQYVSLATNAVGWLNEGLASFFEGTRILPNGTVLMNMPADHRLFPLAERMRKGWMANPQDGYDPNDPNSQPTTAPTWRIIVENRYSWGPAWYAPTWGIVFFCYNFQDPRDGRFVYRDAFWEFIQRSGGKTGESAVKTFEEVVLAAPKPPYDKDVEGAFTLPKTVDELDAVWKDWILKLADERSGRLEEPRPYKMWARAATAGKDYPTAREHFEKGLVATPADTELLLDFADLLAERFKDTDRAAKLVVQALQELEVAPQRNVAAIVAAERRLDKLDPNRKSVTKILDRLRLDVVNLVGRYEAAGLDALVQDLAWRFGRGFDIPELFAHYERAVRARAMRPGTEELAVWELAYDERSLEGWLPGSDAFQAEGVSLVAKGPAYDPDSFTYQTLILDRITAGDFSLEAEVSAQREGASFAGFLFGEKGSGRFHGALFLPARAAKEGAARTAWVDLMTSFGGNETKAWRHLPVDDGEREGSSAGAWNRMRVDVVGTDVDLWWNGELLTSHTFADRDLVLGRLGLAVGNGEARFRNVRFLARDPRDPAGRILRSMRVEALAARGEPVGGSYLGLAPPNPTVKLWAQGEFTGFEAAGPVPQLFVLWSIDQNKLVPIDKWLVSLESQWRDVGLRIVSVCSPNDEPALAAYLAANPFPGAVGVDLRPDGAVGIGVTFEKYFVRRFNLPRLLLVDVDGRVAWEGDPGFAIGETYTEPYDTYLDAPLTELVEKRKLRALGAWRKRWERIAVPALAEQDLTTLLPLMREARAFGATFDPTARAATARLELLEQATVDVVATGEAWAELGAAPAFDLFVREWLPALGVEVPKEAKKAVAALQKHKSVAHYERALKSAAKAAKAADLAVAVAALLTELDGLDGALIEALARDLRVAVASDDEAQLRALLETASSRPRAWIGARLLGQ